MRIAIGVAALLLALGGPIPALLMLGCCSLVHVARSPDRLLDAAFVVAFCTLGYLAGS